MIAVAAESGCAGTARGSTGRRPSAAGRDYEAIEKTASTFIDPDAEPARVLDHLAELAELGIGHAMVSPRRPSDEATLDWAAAMLPDVHAIPIGR